METNFTTDHQAPQPIQLQNTLNVNSIFTKSVESESEIPPQSVLRDASGKLLAGGPGLPGAGRPKGSGLVTDAIKQALRDGKAEEVKETLFELVTGADKDSVRLAAISEIIDRSEGKAVQNIRHAGVFMVMAPGEDVLSAAFSSVAPSEDDDK